MKPSLWIRAAFLPGCMSSATRDHYLPQSLQPAKYHQPVLRRSFTSIVPIFLVDVAMLAGSMWLGSLVLALFFPSVQYAPIRQIAPLLALSMVLFPLFRVYSICGLHPSKEFRAVSSVLVITHVMLLLGNLLFAVELTRYELFLILTSLAISTATLPILRVVVRAFLCRFSWWGWPVLVVGDSAHASQVRRRLASNPMLGMRPVGQVGIDVFDFEDADADRVSAQVKRLIGEHRCERIVIADDFSHGPRLRRLIDLLSSQSEHVILVPALADIPTLWVEAHDIGGMLAIHSRAKVLSPWRLWAKRVLDIALILLLLPLLLPIMLVLAAAIPVLSPGPIFFGHERIGRGGKRFKAWKFRSMVPNANQVLRQYLESHPELQAEWDRDHKLRDDPRIIPGIGSVIRKLSLDELPQLWNVIRGEMSLVGPRPIVEAEVEKYQHVFPLYLKVTPGITGLWQVSGRNNTTYEERINYDAYYVRNWSPWFDVYILARTIRTVLLREGAF